MIDPHHVFDNPIIRTWRIAVPLLVRWQAPSDAAVQLVRKREIVQAWRAKGSSSILDRRAPSPATFPAVAAIHTGRHYLPVEIWVPRGESGAFLRVTAWIAWWVHDAARAAQYPSIRVGKHVESWLNRLVNEQRDQWSIRDASIGQHHLNEVLGDKEWPLDIGITVQSMSLVVSRSNVISSETGDEASRSASRDPLAEEQDHEFRQIRHQIRCLEEQVDAALRLAERLQSLGHRGQEFAELGPLAFLGIQALMHGLNEQIIHALRQELERMEQHRQEMRAIGPPPEGEAPAEAQPSETSSSHDSSSEAVDAASVDGDGAASYVEHQRRFRTLLDVIGEESPHPPPREQDPDR